MAGSSSSLETFPTDRDLPPVRKLCDEVYELYRPTQGNPELELVFFHGFQAQDREDAHIRTWMTADDSVCWIRTWLPERFARARILCLSYDSSAEKSPTKGRMDVYNLGENLTYSLIKLAEVGQRCPVLLIGHCVGGLVLKEVCIQSERLAAQFHDAGVNVYKTFLNYVRGVFFYATPHLGSQLQISKRREHRGPLLEYLEGYCRQSARISEHFSKLRHLRKWITAGVSESSETNYGAYKAIIPIFNSVLNWRRSQSTLIIDEGTSRCDSDEYSILAGEDHFSISRPKSQHSNSYLHLVTFVEKVLRKEEGRKFILNARFQCLQPFVDEERRVEEVIQEVLSEKIEMSRLALVGMSGVGKTTLAKQVFIRITELFDYVCFIEDMSEELKNKQFSTLVKQNLLHGNGVEVCSQGGGEQSVWDLLQGRTVLMVLDGVERMDHIRFLLSNNWCAKGSRLIITSCTAGAELRSHFHIHEVPFLSSKEAKLLFISCLTQDVKNVIPEYLIDGVVEKSDGLPLTLIVLGGCLRTSVDAVEWEGALYKLVKAESVDGGKNPWEKIRVTFDTLPETEKTMFLDLTIFDRSEIPLRFLITAWESTFSAGAVKLGIRNLVARSLMRFPSQDSVEKAYGEDPFVCSIQPKIHQLLRDMGRSILKPSERVRSWTAIWQPRDVDWYLKTKGDDFEVQRLSMSSDDRTINWSYLERLEMLRLVRVANVKFVGDSNPRLPSGVSFLRMINCSRSSPRLSRLTERRSWPIREEDVQGLSRLAVLSMEKCLSVRLPSNFHQLRSLKILEIHSEDMTTLPNDFGDLGTLEALYLQCPKLQMLPGSFLQLCKLTYLHLDCSALKAWPQSPRSALDRRGSTVAPLINLRKLELDGVSALVELPDSFGLMRSLEILNLWDCCALRKLPDSIGNLRKLQDVSIVGCSSLMHIPGSFGQLKSLNSLEIRECGKLWYLPDSLGYLEALEYLTIHDLSIRTLPESIRQLQNLTVLDIGRCSHLESLPGSVGQMGQLIRLDLWECEILKTFSTMTEVYGAVLKGPDIQLSGESSAGCEKGKFSLSIRDCNQLEMLPLTGSIQNLEHLDISGCPNLKDPSCWEDLERDELTRLVWPDSSPVENLPGALMAKLQTLEWLFFPCKQGVPNWLGYMKRLEQLILTNGQVEDLPDSLGNLCALKDLEISNFDRLRTLPESVGHLSSLRTLRISACPCLVILPESLGNLGRLYRLIVKLCNNLKALPASIDQCKLSLELEGCNGMQNLGQLKNCEIWIRNCSQLSSEYLNSLSCRIHRY